MTKKSTRHTGKKLTALLAAFLLIACVLLLTGCGNSGIKAAAQAAYRAAGNPDAEKVSVYHFRGLDSLNAKTCTTPEEAFDIETSQVPENGYIFIFDGNETIYVLMDESCAVVKSANLADLTAYLDSAEAGLNAWIKRLNSDYAAGKMSQIEMETQRNQISAEINKQLQIATRCKALTSYSLDSIILGAQPSDKDEINAWHDLTPKLIRTLQ